jgi:hypothetical protein
MIQKSTRARQALRGFVAIIRAALAVEHISYSPQMIPS